MFVSIHNPLRCAILFAAAILLALLPLRLPAASQVDAVQALREMADLESQIDKTQRRQLDEQRRLLEAGRSLQSVESTLRQKNQLNEEGARFLKNYGERTREAMAEIDRQQTAERQTIEAARLGQDRAASALLAESASGSADAPDLLTLALLQDLHRTRARLASRHSLDLEAQRGDLAGKDEHAADSAAYQTVFSQYSLQQLRDRHNALARQVADSQAQADRQTQEVQQLASRHGQLKNLIARLAEQETARVAAATPSPTPTLAPTIPAVPPVAEQATPVLPAIAIPKTGELARATPVVAGLNEKNNNTAKTGALAEVPYEDGSVPAASTMRVDAPGNSEASSPNRSSTPDKDQTAAGGTRFLFWRASPIGVRALVGGHVIFSGEFAGYRHLLILDHGGGWRSLYGNLVQCALKPGESVQPGQTLGCYQAVQGSRAEPLWFEVRQGTQATAPENWPALPPQWQGRLLAKLTEQVATNAREK